MLINELRFSGYFGSSWLEMEQEFLLEQMLFVDDVIMNARKSDFSKLS